MRKHKNKKIINYRRRNLMTNKHKIPEIDDRQNN